MNIQTQIIVISFLWIYIGIISCLTVLTYDKFKAHKPSIAFIPMHLLLGPLNFILFRLLIHFNNIDIYRYGINGKGGHVPSSYKRYIICYGTQELSYAHNLRSARREKQLVAEAFPGLTAGIYIKDTKSDDRYNKPRNRNYRRWNF